MQRMAGGALFFLFMLLGPPPLIFGVVCNEEMNSLLKFGKDIQSDRELYFLSLDKLESMPVDLEQPITHFACLIACDARPYSAEVISQFIEKLLNLGGVYFCTWGPDCQRVHDIVDEIAAYPENVTSMPDDPVIMTSWHDDEPLAEAFYYFLNCAWPADEYEKTLKSALAVSVGSDAWAKEIKNYLRDPKGFSDTFEYDE